MGRTDEGRQRTYYGQFVGLSQRTTTILTWERTISSCINCLAITINDEKICSDCKTHSDQLEREHAEEKSIEIPSDGGDGGDEYIEFDDVFECVHCGKRLAAEDVGKTNYCCLRCVNLDSAGPFRA